MAHVQFADGPLAEPICSGDEAQSKRGILSLSYPIAHGIVTNWCVQKHEHCICMACVEQLIHKQCVFSMH